MVREKKLEDLNIKLATSISAVANYRLFKKTGNLLFLSGQGPLADGQVQYPGKVGRDISKEEAYQAARITAVNILSVIKTAVGDLDNIAQIVSVKGYINSVDDFEDQPYVLNGASNLFTDVFGEAGVHTRCALSVSSLPMNTCIEIEVIAECL